jgi:hypothetical protein
MGDTVFSITNPITGDFCKIDVDNLYYDGVADVALVKTCIDLTDHPNIPLKLCKKEPKTGDKCYVIGNPGGIDAVSIACGCIRDAKFYSASQTAPSLLLDLSAHGGNSGSAILDESGCVVSIHTFGYNTDARIGGGANLKVLKYSLTGLAELAKIDSAEKRFLCKNFLGLYLENNRMDVNDYYYFYYPEGSECWPNQGEMIFEINNSSNLYGIINMYDLVLEYKLECDGIWREIGSLPGQSSLGELIHQPCTKVAFKVKSIGGPSWGAPYSEVRIVEATLGDYTTAFGAADAPLGGGTSHPTALTLPDGRAGPTARKSPLVLAINK